MGQLLRLFLVLALAAPLAMACSSGDDDDDDDMGDGDSDSDSDADSDADGDSDSDSDADGDGDADCQNPDPCDVYLQCGCEPGDNCTFVGSEKQCVPAATGQQDDPCSDQGLCDVGYTCLSDLTCAKYCNEDIGVRCDAGARCSIALGDENGNQLAMVCATPSNCDALANTGCDGNYACYISNPQDGTTDCAPAGADEVGAVCVHTNDCAPGATCLGFQGQNESHCVAHCDADAETDPCAEGSTCQRLINGSPLGVCVPNA